MHIATASIKEFCDKLSTYFGRAIYGHEPVRVKKYRDVGVLISEADFEEYQRLLNPRARMTRAEWESQFSAIDEVRSHIPHFPPEEVEKDVKQAVAQVRATRRHTP